MYYTIYGLFDKRDTKKHGKIKSKIRYVGSTVRSVWDRAEEHLIEAKKQIDPQKRSKKVQWIRDVDPRYVGVVKLDEGIADSDDEKIQRHQIMLHEDHWIDIIGAYRLVNGRRNVSTKKHKHKNTEKIPKKPKDSAFDSLFDV